MDREQYQNVVHTFFDCQSTVITEIFGEFLAAMEAEQAFLQVRACHRTMKLPKQIQRFIFCLAI
jgi:hypothetical protein